VNTVKPLVPEHTYYETEVVTGKLRRYKSPVIDQMQAKLIQAGDKTLFSNHSAWNKNCHKQWKESITKPVFNKGSTTDCSNYGENSFVNSKISSHIILISLTSYTDKITGNHQSEFQCSTSTTDQIYYHLLHSTEKMGIQ
jgi:hypothetical protein